MVQPPAPDRPRMTPGYGIQPGAEGLLAWDDVAQRLAGARNYWVATTRPDGRPHVMPVWALWLEETFYFSTDPGSRKGRNLAANPAATVHLESGDDVVVLEGEVERVTDRALLARFVEAYEAKYGFRPDPENPEHGVYRLRPRKAFAWTEADFPRNATRWVFPRT